MWNRALIYQTKWGIIVHRRELGWEEVNSVKSVSWLEETVVGPHSQDPIAIHRSSDWETELLSHLIDLID